MYYKNRISVALLSGLCLSAVSLVQAQEVEPGNVYDSSGNPVRGGMDNCVRTTRWNADNVLEKCDPDLVKRAPIAEAVPQPVPEPEPVVPPPVVVPAPKKLPPAVVKKVVLPKGDVLFAFNKSALSANGKKVMADVADDIKKDIHTFPPAYIISIRAHTDRLGSEAYNKKLSLARAHSVEKLLESKGLPREKFYVEGVGSAESITGSDCDNLKPRSGKNKKLVECLQPDRRVEVEILDKPRDNFVPLEPIKAPVKKSHVKKAPHKKTPAK